MPIITEGGSQLDTESGNVLLLESDVSTGSQADFLNRLQLLMPHGWFPNGASSLRDALLTGIANMLAFVYSLFAYVRLQTRIATATDGFLDIIAGDFFGTNLPRGALGDPSYRARIQASIFLTRNTRAALINVLTKITGRTPIVFEPARAADTGGYRVGTLAYGVAGAHGSLSYPYQSFVTAFRPLAGTPQFGITDADIYAAAEGVRMGATVLWVKILS